MEAGESGDTNPIFMKHLFELKQQENFKISTILITHAHVDHFGGLAQCLGSLGYTPQVFKMLTDNQFEREIF